MDLGNFSLSLAVKDLDASLAFYEAFGFAQIAGERAHGWLILQNGDAKIGLFQGMFEQNLITFNPPDARAVERALRDAGYPIDRATEGDEGPCHFALRDPDDNPILVDQH